MCSIFRLALVLVVGVFLFIVVPNAGAVAAQEPAYGTAVVDGDASEWDLNGDFFANMYEAARPDKDLLSKLYMRYDCSTQTIYFLVALGSGYRLDLGDPAGDDFVKIDGTKKVDGSSGDDGIPPDFVYISSGPNKVGWEASFILAPGTYQLNVHTQVYQDRTSAVIDRNIPLTLDCQLGSIGDYVWHDVDGEGDQDEPPANGLANITVRLFKETTPAAFELAGITVTDSNGYYLFTGLAAGSYLVDVHNPDISAAFPAGWVSTTNNDPYPSPAGSAYSLGTGEHHREADFGYDDLGDLVALGDWVWYDEDGQGDQDEPPENGIPCVTVWLYDANGTKIGQGNTDSWGNYYFGGMAASPLYSTEVDVLDPDIDSYIAALNSGPNPATCNMVAEYLNPSPPAPSIPSYSAQAVPTTSTTTSTTQLNTPGTTDLSLDYAFNAPTAISLASFEVAEAASAPGNQAVVAAVMALLGTAALLLRRREGVSYDRLT